MSQPDPEPEMEIWERISRMALVALVFYILFKVIVVIF
jgi:hypothetical protein